jgi:hypothetical protein
MARNSYAEQEAITWQTVGLRLGEIGLDLRNRTTPGALTKLLNARFEADRIVRRNGYHGIRLQHATQFPIFLNGGTSISSAINPVGWIYGHGQQVDPSNPYAIETMHFPEPRVARGTFRYEGSDVVWTGDRLMIVRRDGHSAVGYSDFWGLLVKHAGIPAFLPQQVDSPPPDTVTGNYVETCVTDTQRFVAWATSTGVSLVVVDRATGAVVNRTSVGGAAAYDIRLVQSGAFVVCVWRDANTDLNITKWTGLTWTAASLIDTNIRAFDLAPVPGGFHLLWRDGATLYVGKYAGQNTSSTPYAFQTALSITGTPNGPVAIAVAPDDTLCVVWQSTTGLQAKVFSQSLAQIYAQTTLSATTIWDGGLSVCSRSLKGSPSGVAEPYYRWVVHAGDTNGSVWLVEFLNPASVTRQATRYNSRLGSKSFRVGNEVFCWLRATNSSTLYLVGGIHSAGIYTQVCGIADREEAATRVVQDGVMALPMVVQDPLDEHSFTWARPFYTGQSYTRGGNARIGDLNFLPTFSAAQYGDSVYIAGSHVRCWDGVELGDAGFHDYPIVTAATPGTGGSLTVNSAYQYRVYPVRYNKRGERFMGAALTYAASTGASDTKLTLTIKTLPVTNHDDVVFEVYRTEAGQTTFRLEGTVANSLTAGTVSFVSQMSDATLRTQPADSHEVGVSGPEEVEEFGPIGCAFLVAAGDRLWGAGGQVPRGFVQFSKLKEPKEGAGFDALAGTQQIDTEGGEIISIANFSDSLVIFERDRIYVLFGGGPDNYGNGAFSTPQLVLADGAVSHAGTCVTQLGVLFWGVDGPRLLTPAFKVEQICDPVRKLTETLSPSGVQADLVRREVVWFTREGTAVLFNYAGQRPRWAQWTGLKIAGCSDSALVTTDGLLLQEDPDANGDNGVPFEYGGATGELDLEQLLLGCTELNRVGVVGEYKGPHRLRLRIYFNGSPMWTDQQVWDPRDKTWLASVEDVANLTPAQVDALNATDQSGKYATHKKVSRHSCASFRVEWSDMGAFRPTYQLHQLVFELGARGGLARVPASTFTRS